MIKANQSQSRLIQVETIIGPLGLAFQGTSELAYKHYSCEDTGLQARFSHRNGQRGRCNSRFHLAEGRAGSSHGTGEGPEPSPGKCEER